MEHKDVVVIGGGPAGYAAAIRAAQLGGKVTLIEKGTAGGACVSRGCIPVRGLVRVAELLDLGKSARDYGINYGEATVDLGRLMARKDTVVKTVTSGVRLLLEANGVEVLAGTAAFTAPGELQVARADGSSTSIAARRTIIATGSRCARAEGWGARALTTDEALELKEIPASILIVGAGFIGLAFATIFSRLGSKVTVIEASTNLLPGVDAEIVAILSKELKRNKVTLHTEAQQAAGRAQPSTGIAVAVRGEPLVIEAAAVLVTGGRTPGLDGLGLDRAGVSLNGKGGIAVSRRMETGAAGIFAAGDVTMEHAWTHVAYAEGIVAAENAMGRTSEMDYSVLPLCANTLPEVAGVGLTEESAVAAGYGVKTGRFPFAANSTATIMGQRTGMIKIVSEEKYGQILGAHIIGPQASTLISEVALAMKLEATAEDIGALLHGHPTLSEVVWEAARDVSGESIHITKA